MKFKGRLATPTINIVASPPFNTLLSFTKNQIVFPADLPDSAFLSRNICHGAKYTLQYTPNIYRNDRYQIIVNGEMFRLLIDNDNDERKLKFIHTIFWWSKEPLATISLLVAIAALIVSIVK